MENQKKKEENQKKEREKDQLHLTKTIEIHRERWRDWFVKQEDKWSLFEKKKHLIPKKKNENN